MIPVFMAIGLIVLNGCECHNYEVAVYIKQLKCEDKHLRREAADVLGQFEDARAVEPLLDVLQDQEEDRTVRESVAIALGQLGDKRAVEPLIAVLKDTGDSVRSSAAFALGQLGEAQAMEPLIASGQYHH